MDSCDLGPANGKAVPRFGRAFHQGRAMMDGAIELGELLAMSTCFETCEATIVDLDDEDR